MRWQEYQKRAAEFFSGLKMATEVDGRLQGARAAHDVDVVVRFTAYGIDHLWVVECKQWNRRVPKERVLTLQQLASDVGAHRAFLLCERGFQSGAVTAARLSNVTLTNLEDLRTNAEADIQLVRWDDLYLRLASVRKQLDSLTLAARADDRGGTIVIKPGVGDEFFSWLGAASVLESSLVRSRLGQFPVVCVSDQTGKRPKLAHDMETFLERGDEVLQDIERWTSEQAAKPWPNKPVSVYADRRCRAGT